MGPRAVVEMLVRGRRVHGGLARIRADAGVVTVVIHFMHSLLLAALQVGY
jgi:hypothetical protein